ncbi:unnamed protein product [Cyprideis torosa]|uniref:Uncharacterized protein n=1 Tax=Cyprideis torosa TaxID=163714 RepID=A0A7R8WEU4_9CRUS|nr:unnamed protein product [Cyprideis torosa]CAG0890184.1 unnamed protein product [Cyprideis torosa]
MEVLLLFFLIPGLESTPQKFFQLFNHTCVTGSPIQRTMGSVGCAVQCIQATFGTQWAECTGYAWNEGSSECKICNDGPIVDFRPDLQESGVEDMFLRDSGPHMVTSSVWLGINDEDMDNVFTNSDGTPVDYTQWHNNLIALVSGGPFEPLGDVISPTKYQLEIKPFDQTKNWAVEGKFMDVYSLISSLPYLEGTVQINFKVKPTSRQGSGSPAPSPPTSESTQDSVSPIPTPPITESTQDSVSPITNQPISESTQPNSTPNEPVPPVIQNMKAIVVHAGSGLGDEKALKEMGQKAQVQSAQVSIGGEKVDVETTSYDKDKEQLTVSLKSDLKPDSEGSITFAFSYTAKDDKGLGIFHTKEACKESLNQQLSKDSLNQQLSKESLNQQWSKESLNQQLSKESLNQQNGLPTRLSHPYRQASLLHIFIQLEPATRFPVSMIQAVIIQAMIQAVIISQSKEMRGGLP